jgi:3'-5' exoribonuclease
VVDKYAAQIPHFPHGMKTHLKHILLSHHGEYEYGSPKIPQTSEAYLVHLIDHMDSKMNALEMVKRSDSQAGSWTGFVKHLDRIVYKSDLPFYPEMLAQGPAEQEERPASRPALKAAPAPTPKPREDRAPKEIKQNLGKMLEGFKPGKD